MQKVVVYGAYGHAKVIVDILELQGYELIGLIDYREQHAIGSTVAGVPVLGSDPALNAVFEMGTRNAFVAIGNNQLRLETGQRLVERGFTLINAIHPSSLIARRAHIGFGTMVGAGAVINPDAVIGNHVIVNTSASVDHDCVISDGVQLCPGVRLAGSVEVGERTDIGTGAVVIPNIRIGSDVRVGAGSVVVRDVPDGVTVYGNPAHHSLKRT